MMVAASVRTIAILVILLSGQQLAWLIALGRVPAHPLQIVIFLGTELAFAAAIAIALLAIQRPNRLAVTLSVVMPLMLLNISWVKFTILGDQAYIADAFLIPDLLRALPPYVVAVVVAFVLAYAAILISNLHRGRFILAVVLLAACGSAPRLVSDASIGRLSEVVGNLRGRVSMFPTRGHFLAALTVYLEEIEEESLDRGLAAGAQSVRQLDVRAATRLELRNVHVIVLESFADPVSLFHFAFRPDPFPPLLATWREAAPGHLLAPVFGNRSSNTEFEVLCGLPAFAGRSRVVIMQLGAAETPPCLPRILAGQGFRTASLVPSSPEIFRAGEAFAAMGFATRWFEAEAMSDDRDGIWISAEATLAASRRLHAGLPGTGPALIYTFVNAGHYPFDRDRVRRPDRIAISPSHAAVEAWTNAVHHTALAVAAHIEALHRRDPEALVMVLGDHQPILGHAFSGHREGGAIAQDDDSDPLTRAGLYVTPLIVLDRGRIVSTGALPAWHVPYLVLDLLSRGASCDTEADTCPHRRPMRLRPIADRTLVVDAGGGEVMNCPLRSTDTGCAEVLVATARLRASLAHLLGIRTP